jgi:hypothetical protein
MAGFEIQCASKRFAANSDVTGVIAFPCSSAKVSSVDGDLNLPRGADAMLASDPSRKMRQSPALAIWLALFRFLASDNLASIRNLAGRAGFHSFHQAG